MLTAATLGMAGYATFSIASGVLGLLGLLPFHLEVIANLGLVLLGFLLLLASAFVRVRFPGGLALALGALLGLQGLSLHNDMHIYGSLTLPPQAIRGGLAAVLFLLAYLGSHSAEPGGFEAEPGEQRASQSRE